MAGFIVMFWLVAITLLTFNNCSVYCEENSDSVGSLFKEIGFSPSCVSKTLSLCEESVRTSSIISMLKSLQKSIDEGGFNRQPRNCADLQKRGDNETGVRTVYPFSCCQHRPVRVYCDQTLDGGGWTVIQHREDLPQREDFFRKWVEYEIGFGSLTGEFWLGLRNIHALVDETLMELRVDLEDYTEKKVWAKYSYFFIDNEAENYRLDLGTYSGNAGDSFASSNGQMFSTHDKDHDTYPDSCATKFRGAWWYAACHGSNLNGFQYEGNHTSYADGINWSGFRGYHHSLKTATMSIRPIFQN